MTPKQIENTKILIEVLKEKVNRNDPAMLLDTYFQPCGTKGCVLGDYLLKRYKRKKIRVDLEDKYNEPDVRDTVFKHLDRILSNFKEEFGFYRYFDNSFVPLEDGTEYFLDNNVIGDSMRGSYKKRLEYVENQLLLGTS